MIIFPAMDIKDGKCVRLYKGDFSTSQIVGENPVNTALELKSQGAEYIHMVDLDGALKGSTANLKVISQVSEAIRMPIQLGGGIRDMKTIEKILEIGVTRVILGTAALNNPDFLKEAVKQYKDAIAVGIDAKDGYVAVEGWVNISKVNYIDFGKEMENIGVKTIIFTDVSRDGTLTGPNFEQTLKLKDAVKCNIIASGGVKDIDDINILAENNVYGVIVGKAIYSGNVMLREAIDRGRE
jgi:phosphoribosylformimino-5-aminoimidazole carboxamide ribotide isomerase